MLKILVVSQYASADKGGAERYIHEVTRRLRQRGAEVFIMSADGLGDQQIDQPWKCFSAGFHPLWPSQVDRIIETVKPDCVFAHFTVPGITDVAVRRAGKHGIPVCLAYHSDVTGTDRIRRILGSGYYLIIGRNTLHKADRIIVSSPEYQASSPWLKRLDKKFDYVMPGVDEDMAKGRAGLFNPGLLFVGKSQSRSKGFDILYDAWLEARNEYPGLELRAAGYFSRQEQYPGVKFLGQINSRQMLADVYASSSLTILPSTTTAESFGMVLAESLIAGTPVIGSDMGGIPAIVNDGFNGYLARPGDKKSLVEAIIRGLRDEKALRQNIESSREEYLEMFSWDGGAQKIYDILMRCVHQRG